MILALSPANPSRQWVIEDNFVNGRPDWDTVGAQFVADVRTV
ncbi:D-mannonate oxidoreductase [Salmonella enterica subsp. enterica]|uniref:D-mannonate oxidoreductase n=1 Tax=Salmonella enterica I TaxID=59201 RepID=A0A379WLF2_SALET|nr:D-mannonate oxidoreductase [Salmonella enterica subsp. enterica]